MKNERRILGLRRSECFYCGLIVAGDGGYLPVLKVEGELVSFTFSSESDPLGDSLEILDGTTEVDATHCLDEDGEFLSTLNCRQDYTLLILHTINLTNILAVDKHLGKVVAVIESEQRGCGDCG